jgi:ATP-binding cassette subfamily B protein
MLRMQTSFLAGAVPGTLLSASSAAVMLWGGYEIFNGRLTIGTLVAFMAYHQRLFAPIQGCWASPPRWRKRVALARIFELIDTPAEVVEAPDAAPLPAIAQSIAFDRVSLSHGANRCWWRRISPFPWQLCALLGPSARANPPSRI